MDIVRKTCDSMKPRSIAGKQGELNKTPTSVDQSWFHSLVAAIRHSCPLEVHSLKQFFKKTLETVVFLKL